MKKIAKDEFEVAEVMGNLNIHEKVDRVSKLYSVDEILDVLGYHDGSIDEKDAAKIDETKEETEERDFIVYLLAINNGNFEQAIAMNVCLPI